MPVAQRFVRDAQILQFVVRRKVPEDEQRDETEENEQVLGDFHLYLLFDKPVLKQMTNVRQNIENLNSPGK